MKKIESIPFFFILGRPRTGTTLLRTLFDAHPNVCIPLESPVIVSLYHKYGKIKKWDDQNIISFYNDLFKQRLFDTWTIDKEKLKKDLLKSKGQNSFNTLIKIVYSNYISLYDKKDIQLFGDKNPVYILYIKKLLKRFPEAKFIFIIRDYRDNFLSIKKVDFEAPIVPLIAYRWRYSVKRIMKLENKYPERFYNIKYEDLVMDPECYLMRMCDFLEIEYCPSVMEFYTKKDKATKIYSKKVIEKYHKSLINPINTTSLGLWRKQMTRKEIKISDFIVGKYAEISGYSREYKKVNIFFYIRFSPIIIYGSLLNYIMIYSESLPYGIKMWFVKRLPLLAKTYIKLFK